MAENTKKSPFPHAEEYLARRKENMPQVGFVSSESKDEDEEMLEFSFTIDDPDLVSRLFHKETPTEETNLDAMADMTAAEELPKVPVSNKEKAEVYKAATFMPIETKILRFTVVPTFFAEGSKSNLSITNTLLLLYLFGEMGYIYNVNTDNKYYCFKLDEFAKIFKMTEASMLTTFQRSIDAFTEYTYSADDFHWFKVFECVFIKDKNLHVVLDGDFVAKFKENATEEAKPIYGNFAKITKLTNNYEVWLYLLCRRFINTGTRFRDREVNQFQRRLGIEHLKIKPWNKYTTRIESACEHISKLTDLVVTPKIVIKKRGRTFNQQVVIFFIEKKNSEMSLSEKTKEKKAKEIVDRLNQPEELFKDWV